MEVNSSTAGQLNMLSDTMRAIHIAFACDDQYARHIPVVIQSVNANKLEGTSVVYYVLCAELSSKSRKLIDETGEVVEIVEVSGEPFKDCPVFEPNQKCGHITLPTYYRFALAEILPDLSKVIYLDCDTIVTSPIEELWDIDLSDRYASASPELGISRFDNNHHVELGLPLDQIYFNAGVMMLNLDEWRTCDIGKQLFNNVTLLRDRIKFVDQDVLNFTLGSNVLVLSDRFNFQESGNDPRDRQVDLNYPAIIHFLGADKPWNPACENRYRHEYLKYLSRMELVLFYARCVAHFIYSKKVGPGSIDIIFFGIVVYKRRLKHDGRVRLEVARMISFKPRNRLDYTLKVLGLCVLKRREKNDGRVRFEFVKLFKLEYLNGRGCTLKLLGLSLYKKRIKRGETPEAVRIQIRVLGVRLTKK